MNKFLEKIAKDEKNDSKGYTPWGKAGVALGVSTATNLAAVSSLKPLTKKLIAPESGLITEADVSSYVNRKKLHNVVRINERHPLAVAAFAPRGGYRHKPYVITNSPSLALREYGHARHLGPNSHVNDRRFKLYSTSTRLAQTGTIGLVGAAMGTSDNEKVRKAAPYAAAAAAAPMLYEEAAASISPYKHLRKTRGAEVANHFLKRIGAGFGTYAAMGASGVGAAVGAKYLQERKIKQNEGKN